MHGKNDLIRLTADSYFLGALPFILLWHIAMRLTHPRFDKNAP